MSDNNSMFSRSLSEDQKNIMRGIKMPCCEKPQQENAKLKEQLKQYQWRSVEDELPEWNDHVLAICREDNLKHIIYADIGFKFEFTHWMPIPKFEERR